MKNKQLGFAAIETLVALIFLAVIGFAAYTVWHGRQTTKASASSANHMVPDNTPATAAKAALLYQGQGYATYQMSKLATTTDQKAIAAILDQQCQARAGAQAENSSIVAATGAADLFINGGKVRNSSGVGYNFQRSGDLAVVNTACYDKTLGGEQDGAANAFLYHGTAGWHFLAMTQDALDCTADGIDGKGIHTTMKICAVVGTAKDGSQTISSRVPKP